MFDQESSKKFIKFIHDNDLYFSQVHDHYRTLKLIFNEEANWGYSDKSPKTVTNVNIFDEVIFFLQNLSTNDDFTFEINIETIGDKKCLELKEEFIENNLKLDKINSELINLGSLKCSVKADNIREIFLPFERNNNFDKLKFHKAKYQFLTPDEWYNWEITMVKLTNPYITIKFGKNSQFFKIAYEGSFDHGWE